jgi:hypothetical protein
MVMSSAKQLLKALLAVERDGWSAADLKQLYSAALPAARRLAPLEGVHPLTSSDIKAADKGPLAVQLVSILVWVLRGMHEQHFRGEVLTHQACELVCALADVLHVLCLPDSSQPSSSSSSSSRSRWGRGTAWGRLLKQLEDTAGEAWQLAYAVLHPYATAIAS